MADEDQHNPDSDAPDANLPGAARQMAVEYPQLWQASTSSRSVSSSV
jgi:hypothetical protein